jgi:putative transposon-encoded protein
MTENEDNEKMENDTESQVRSGPRKTKNVVKFEAYGEEMIEKEVKLSGNSGRIYLPPNWVGHRVKIIRID